MFLFVHTRSLHRRLRQSRGIRGAIIRRASWTSVSPFAVVGKYLYSFSNDRILTFVGGMPGNALSASPLPDKPFLTSMFILEDLDRSPQIQSNLCDDDCCPCKKPFSEFNNHPSAISIAFVMTSELSDSRHAHRYRYFTDAYTLLQRDCDEMMDIYFF